MTFLDDTNMTDKEQEKQIAENKKNTTRVHKFRHAGLDCWICYYKDHWNGYVAVPNTHMLYNKTYYDLDLERPYGITYGEHFNPCNNTHDKSVFIYGTDTKLRDECNDRNFTLRNIKSLAEQIANYKGYAVAVESGVGDDAIRVFHNPFGAGDDRPIIKQELAETIELAIKSCKTSWRPCENDIAGYDNGKSVVRLPISIFEITAKEASE